MWIFILLGAFIFPIFTLGCVLINYDHPIVGSIVVLIAIFKNTDKDDKENL